MVSPLASSAWYAVAVNSTMFSGFSLLVYDHLLTIGDEVEFIWKRKRNIVSVIFVLNRYLVPGILAVDAYERLSPHPVTFCKIWLFIRGYFTFLCYISIHAVVAIRVNAVHGNMRSIRLFLWLGGTFYILSTFGLITVAFGTIMDELTMSKGLCLSKIKSYTWVAWLPTIIVETALFSLTARLAAFRFSQKMECGTYYGSIFLEALIYFAIVSAGAIFSLVVWARAPVTLLGLSQPFSLCIVAISGNRLTLNLRRLVSEKKERSALGSKYSLGTSFVFANGERHCSATDVEAHSE